jgi:signal transduction histidine kinase/CheY-like chemotaxis protein
VNYGIQDWPLMRTPDNVALADMINAMDIKWAYIDTSMRYTALNDNLAQWLDIDSEELVGKQVLEIIDEQGVKKLTPLWAKVLEGKTASIKDYITFVGHGPKFINLTYIPDIQDDKVIGFYACFQDSTEQNRTISILEGLHAYTSDTSLSFTEKINGLLSLGRTAFNLPLALISRISDDKYFVKYSSTPNGEISPGDTFDVNGTYCVHTLAADGPTAFNHAGNSEIKNHPCYKDFALESYIGTPLLVNGLRYGTLNFSGPEVTINEFTHNDLNLIQLLARWIGNELSRNSVEKSLNRQQKLLESMSQQGRIGAWELDLVKNTVYWSSMTKIIHEVPKDFVPDLEKGIFFYKEGYSRDRITEVIGHCIESGTPCHEELQLVTAKGNEIWVLATGNAEFENGVAVKIFGSFQDIDARVKTELELKLAKEEAEMAVRSKGAFLANMSHEIRTPMNGVIGMLNLLKNSSLTEEQLHYANLASTSGHSLINLINDILDFSKIEAGKLDLECIDFDLSILMGDFSESMAFSAQEKGLELVLDYKNNNSKFVKGDPGRLNQVLTNLTGNAIKFTHEGCIVISVEDRPHYSDANKCLLEFCVKDTGIGIDPKKQISLFEKFTQADDSTTREYGGTGLGLSIARQICMLMNGDITLSSELGKGSEFSFTIEMQMSDKNSETKFELSFENNKIVLFSEVDEIRSIACAQLKRMGANQVECLSLQKSKNPAELVTDSTQILIIDIPVKKQLDIKKLDGLIKYAAGKPCTSILLSEISKCEALKQQYGSQVDVIIPKPLTPHELIRFMRQFKQDPGGLNKMFSSIDVKDEIQPSKALAMKRFTKLLLVEDNLINQEVAKELLLDMGYTADIANNGQEALNILNDNQSDPYDVILMDCQMPEMDGYQATEGIRIGQAGAEYLNVPIIALTANAMKGDKQKCLDAGMDDYLSKPIDPVKLEAKLDHYLRKR